MLRTMWTPALALGAVLGVNGFAAAADTPAQSATGTTMTLGGKGTAAQAAASIDDTELACCRRYHGCYGGYGGGYGYSSYYGGGYGGGFGYSSYYSYRPYYGGGYGYRPYSSYYGGYGGGYGGYGYGGYGRGGFIGIGIGGFRRISGDESDANTPAVSLGLSVANNPVVQTLKPDQMGGGLRYDGGPANPVPLAKPTTTTTQAAPATGLPVSLPNAKSPYTYKAYGEK